MKLSDLGSNGSYTCREMIWNARFKPMYFSREGHTVLELDLIDDIERLEEE